MELLSAKELHMWTVTLPVTMTLFSVSFCHFLSELMLYALSFP